MVINFKCGKKAKNNLRFFRESDLFSMGTDSVSEQAYLYVADENKKHIDKAKTKFKKNMVNILFPDFKKTSYTEDDYKKQIELCIEVNADAILSIGQENENATTAKQRLQLLEKNQRELKDNIFVLHYTADNGIFMLINEEFPDCVDAIGIFVGNYLYGSKAFEQVANKIIYAKRILQKPVFLFGVPVKVFGNNNKDIRFFPFYQAICDGWSKCWRQAVIKSSTIRVVDSEDYFCKTYTDFIKNHAPNETMRLTERTIYDFFHNTKRGERMDYERLVIDEELSKLSEEEIRPIQELIVEKAHENYLRPLLESLSCRVLQNTVEEVRQVNPAWNSVVLRKAVYRRGSTVMPEKAHMAAKRAIEWMQESIRNEQKPSLQEFIEIFNKSLGEGDALSA